MKLYTYFPSVGLETIEALEKSGGARLEIEHNFAGLAGRFLVDRCAVDVGGTYYSTPELALRHFIARGEARLTEVHLSAVDRRGWKKTLKIAREKLAFLGGRPA